MVEQSEEPIDKDELVTIPVDIVVPKKDPRGGKREGAGRKKIAAEKSTMRLSQAAIVRNYGSLEKYFDMLALRSLTDNKILELMHKYAFGVPVQPKDMVDQINEPEQEKLTAKNIRKIAKTLEEKY